MSSRNYDTSSASTISKKVKNIIDPLEMKRENGINYNLFMRCSKMFKKHHHQSFLKAKNEIRCSLTLGFVWSPYFLKKNSLCSTPNNRILKGVQKTSSRIQFLLPQLPSCDIKTNENFTGFGFSERCWKIATSKLYKTRSEQKCIFDGVKFISVTILKHGLTTKQQTHFGKTEIIWTLITTQNKNHFYNYYHHLF
jgi:hypothetical protein